MAQPVDREEAARFLAERYGPAATDVAELGGGDWSRAFSFRLDGRDLVARFGRHVEDFQKDREAMVYAGPELPVPAVLEIGEALGGFFAISERHFGIFLEELNERQWRSVLPALLRALDHLRSVTLSTLTPQPSTRWREWLLSSLEDPPGGRVSGWRAALHELPHIEEVFVFGERALRELLPACPEVGHVIHRDLLNRNVLVEPDGSRLTAVFDWGCSKVGDFLYELAWFTFWAPWYPAMEALDLRRVFQEHYRSIGLEVPGFDDRLTAYELQIGLEHIAYSTFTKRDADRQEVTRRTAQVLRRRNA